MSVARLTSGRWVVKLTKIPAGNDSDGRPMHISRRRLPVDRRCPSPSPLRHGSCDRDPRPLPRPPASQPEVTPMQPLAPFATAPDTEPNFALLRLHGWIINGCYGQYCVAFRGR